MLLGLILLVLAVLLLLPYSLELQYNRVQRDSEAKIVLWIWKLPLHFRIGYLEKLGEYIYMRANLKASQADAEIKPTVSLKQVFQSMQTPLPRWLRAFAKAALFFLQEIERLEIKLRYSTGEASVTGIAAGAAWWVLSTAVAFLNQRFVFLKKPQIRVVPVFGQRVFELYLHCIFRIRLGHIMTKRIKQQLSPGKGG